MESFNIIFVTDNEDGRNLADHICKIGIFVSLYDNFDNITDCLNQSKKLLIVVDIRKTDANDLLNSISAISGIDSVVKYVLLDKKFIDGKLLKTDDIMNLELISRPIDGREFSLLLEKTLLVEKYRQMMTEISSESKSRVEIFELLMAISRKNSLGEGANREMLVQILDFEKNLMNEQLMINESIRKIALLRNMEFLEMKDRINAEEMLDQLRRQELINANSVIGAQESLIDYSSKELYEAQKIISATENVAELSRAEALKLHQEMDELKKNNEELCALIERLGGKSELAKKKG